MYLNLPSSRQKSAKRHHYDAILHSAKPHYRFCFPAGGLQPPRPAVAAADVNADVAAVVAAVRVAVLQLEMLLALLMILPSTPPKHTHTHTVITQTAGNSSCFRGQEQLETAAVSWDKNVALCSYGHIT